MKRQKFILLFISLILMFSCKDSARHTGGRWSQQEAWDYYNSFPWMAGANFNPSTAINQLEFWQAETFDPETIDRELGWSADLGMNLHRVYLHNLVWETDSAGFLQRLNTFLDLADKHQIKIMFVLLDDVWNPYPKAGKQPEPKPFVHNSGWVQAPGAEILGDSSRHAELRPYIMGMIGAFADDRRVAYWDLYNEPANRGTNDVENKAVYSLSLLRKVFRWAREVNPSQPLTCGLWTGNIENWGTPGSLPPLDRFMVNHSDVISFHAYDSDPSTVQQKIDELKKYGRPLLCTEYMARTNNNTFMNVMPLLKRNNVAAINWGFVSGKTNTIYPWGSGPDKYSAEPKVWFHDILRKDGTPFSPIETELIKTLTSK